MKPKGVSDFPNSILRLSTIVFATGAFTASVHAADYTWGGGNSSWTDTTATGWNGGPPVGGDTAAINSGTVTPTVNDQQYGVALTLGSAGALNDGGFYTYFGPSGSLTLNGGTINITRNNGYYFGWYDGSLSPVVNANSGSSFINTTNASGGLRLEGDTTFSGDGNLTIGLGLHNYTDGLGFFGATNITKSGSGTLTLAGASTYSGNTNVNGGTLVLEGSGQLYSNLGWQDRAVTVNSGGTLQVDRWDGGGSLGQLGYNQANIVIDGGTIRFTGNSNGTSEGPGFTIGASGATLESAAPAGQVWNINNDNRSAAFGIASNSGGLLTLSGTGDGLVSKVIGGAGGLTKTGAGTWTLSGANTYTGTTTVSGGTLSLTSPFLDNDSSVIIGSGATMNLNFTGSDIIGSLQINGSLPLPPGLYNSGHGTYGSYFTGSGTLVVITDASGSWTSLADGDWDNPTNWNANTIATGIDQTATFNQATGVTVTLTSNQIIGNLAFDTSDYTLGGSSTLTLETSSGTPAISVGAGRIATVSATINGFAGMEKTGAGTLVLTAANTYSGETTVNAGTLDLQTGGETGTIRGTLSINSGATVNLNAVDALGWAATPVSQVTINGGTLDNAVDGNNSYVTDYTLTGGTVSSTGGGAFNFNNGYGITTLASASPSLFSAPIYLRNNNSLPINVADGAAAVDFEVSGAIGQLLTVGGVTKSGAGTAVFSGVNTYTGNTFVDEGTLELTSTSQMQFVVTDAPASNQITGAGTATFDCTFNIDTSAVTGTTGYIWSLVDRASLTGESFGSNFSVAGFSPELDGVTWTMSDSRGTWSFSEEFGELTLVVSSDYEDWVTANGVVGTETDDDDNDGLSNFEEYAFGLDPTGGSSVNPITSQLDKATKKFSYTRRATNLPDPTLTYSVWFSTDLSTWTQDTGATEGTPVLNGEVETVEVTLSALPGDPLPAKLFIQVRAE